jgi:hypothetical protein
MSLRRAAKRDDVEAEILDAWKAAGGDYICINAKGKPDVLLWHQITGFLLVENKSRHGKMTPAQIDWQTLWRGPKPVILRSVQDAMALLRR